MSMKNDILRAPKLYFVLIAVLFAVFVLLVTGMSSPEWAVVYAFLDGTSVQVANYGLWTICPHYASCTVSKSVYARYRAFRAFLSFAILLAVGTEVNVLIFTALPRFRTRVNCAWMMLGCFFTVVADFIGILLFVVYFNPPIRQGTVSFGWGLGVTAAGGTLCLFALGLAILIAVRTPSTPMTLANRPV